MQPETDRLQLPLLVTAQAQKEMTHNEALAMLDALVQPVVVSVAPTAVPVAPTAGQAWIVGAGAAGAWTGHDGAIAIFGSGGWRFCAAREGMSVWSVADGLVFRRVGSGWVGGAVTATSVSIGGQQVVGSRGAAIADLLGGTNVDAEARAVLAAVLERMRTHGLIAA